MRFILIASLCCLVPGIYSSCTSHKKNPNCVVELKTGQIQGDCSRKLYDAYTNIPYAEPPVGKRSFESPHPIDHWKGVKRTVGMPVTCIEFVDIPNYGMVGTEDCLKVHVYVPKRPRLSKTSHKRLMVMVNIPAGTFQVGSPANDPTRLMKTGDAIVVTMGYRQGPLGFLSMYDKHLPGNLGLKDQRLALNWVNKNIDAFGGDPKKVLVFGGSAGGASAELHMITGSRNAAAYVSLGGSPLNPWAFTLKPKKSALELAKLLKCSCSHGYELKECLKSRSVREIWEANNKMYKFYGFSVALFRPTIEPPCVADAFITEEPLELINRGINNHIPFMMAASRGAGTYPASKLTALNDKNQEALTELNSRWLELCPLMFFYDETKTKQEQMVACKKLRKDYMCGLPFNLNTYKAIEVMFAQVYTYDGIDLSVNLHRKAGRKITAAIGILPMRYTLGNVFKNRLDLCFGRSYGADIISIFPLRGVLPAEKYTKSQEDTFDHLVKFIKSMLTKTPQYKHIHVPINLDDDKPLSCLHYTYGKEHIAQCVPEPPICKNIPSVKCHTEKVNKKVNHHKDHSKKSCHSKGCLKKNDSKQNHPKKENKINEKVYVHKVNSKKGCHSKGCLKKNDSKQNHPKKENKMNEKVYVHKVNSKKGCRSKGCLKKNCHSKGCLKKGCHGKDCFKKINHGKIVLKKDCHGKDCRKKIVRQSKGGHKKCSQGTDQHGKSCHKKKNHLHKKRYHFKHCHKKGCHSQESSRQRMFAWKKGCHSKLCHKKSFHSIDIHQKKGHCKNKCHKKHCDH